MADNYLEKKMEEHKRGTSLKTPRILSPIGERPGMVSFKIDQLRVFVTDASTEIGTAVVRRLREAGCKVAFVSSDDKSGRNLAQASGARHYPRGFRGSVVDDIAEAWGGIDVMVVDSGGAMDDNVNVENVILIGESPRVICREGIRINAIDTTSLCAREVAHLCLLLCLKESACLNGVSLGTF